MSDQNIPSNPMVTPTEADELIRWHTMCAAVSAQTDDFAGARWHREKLAAWKAWKGGKRGFPAETRDEWLPVETFDFEQGFAQSRWVFVHTSDGRVTEGQPFIMDGDKRIWVCARGSNAHDPRYLPEKSCLRDAVLHWRPLPTAPTSQVKASDDEETEVCRHMYIPVSSDNDHCAACDKPKDQCSASKTSGEPT